MWYKEEAMKINKTLHYQEFITNKEKLLADDNIHVIKLDLESLQHVCLL